MAGLCASYVAKLFPVDALICDRTFASLESTAMKLLGSWAAYGLQIFAWWNTDVTTDYLSCNCPKLIFQVSNCNAFFIQLSSVYFDVKLISVCRLFCHQDHDDEIIHDVAALKSGISLRIVMGDKSWKSCTEPREYAYASFINAPLPNINSEAQWLAAANDLSQQIPEGFITHLYGCLMDVSKRAAAKNTKKKPQSSAQRGAGDVEMAQIQSNSQYSLLLDSGNPGDEIVQDLNDAHRSTTEALRSNVTAKMNPPAPLINSNDGGDSSDRSADESDDQSDVSQAHKVQFSSRREWLEAFCGLSIYADSSSDTRLCCNASMKAWATVARVDGGSGQLLGQALAKGVDSVRCWVSSYIVWKNYSSADQTLPRGATTLPTALKELEELATTLHEAELGNIQSISFLRQAFACIIKRQEAHKFHNPSESPLLMGAASYHTLHAAGDGDFRADDQRGIEEGWTSSNSGANAAAASDSGRLREDIVTCLGGDNCHLLRCLRGNQCLHSTFLFLSNFIHPVSCWHKVRSCLSTNPYIPVESCAADIDSTTRGDAGYLNRNRVGSSSSHYVGQIIPLHCGHNGWPSNYNIKTFNDFLTKHAL